MLRARHGMQPVGLFNRLDLAPKSSSELWRIPDRICEKLISAAPTTLTVSFSYSKQRFPIRIQPTPSLVASRSQLYGVASRAYQMTRRNRPY